MSKPDIYNINYSKQPKPSMLIDVPSSYKSRDRIRADIDKMTHTDMKSLLLKSLGVFGAAVFIGSVILPRYHVANANQFLAKTGFFITKLDPITKLKCPSARVSRRMFQWPLQKIHRYDLTLKANKFQFYKPITKDKIKLLVNISFKYRPKYDDDDNINNNKYAAHYATLIESECYSNQHLADIHIMNSIKKSTQQEIIKIASQYTWKELQNKDKMAEFQEKVFLKLQNNFNSFGLEIPLIDGIKTTDLPAPNIDSKPL